MTAKRIAEEYGGVFLADVVGLSKTCMAAMLADKRFFEPLARESLPSLADHNGKEIQVIREQFESLSARDHAIRRNLHSLSELESVRINEGKA